MKRTIKCEDCKRDVEYKADTVMVLCRCGNMIDLRYDLII